MFIEELVIDGFKSYATRTVLSGFDQCFNAITGLNGSGKSNILDAICFVLGISNLSQVRAGNLQELVYKQGQAGVTKASVTLVFNNLDKSGSPVGYEHLDQLTITRQVVIGGKSKYLINGHTAQAGQIQNLFHSVQLNVNNPHFLIMQGRITKVLNMKPPEILSMIEEAAGTRMFETKKLGALKTIEKKQSKVDEIDEILEKEITPTLERLRGEKTSYLKWSANNTEIERLGRFCAALEYSKAAATLARSEKEMDELQASHTELSATIKQLTEGINSTNKQLDMLVAEKEGKEGGTFKQVQKAEESLGKDLVKVTAEWENKKLAVKNEVRALEQLKRGEEESGSLILVKEQAIQKIQIALEKAGILAAEKAEAERKLNTEYHNFCAGVSVSKASGSNDDARTLIDQITSCQEEIESSAASAERGTMRSKHLRKEVMKLKKEVEEAEKATKGLNARREKVLKAVEVAESKLSRLASGAAEAESLKVEIENAEASMTEAEELVERLSAELEGRLAFDFASPSTGFNRSKVKGLVARLVRVIDSSTATALEVVAGGKLYQVVVDTQQTGKALLLKGKLKCRVTIIPLNTVTSRGLDKKQLSRASDVAARSGGTARCALELVGYDAEVEAAMKYTFGSSIVCESLPVAKSVAFDKGVRIRTVTLEGDSFEPQGTLTGGSKSALGSVLTKLLQLEEAKGAVNKARATWDSACAHLSKVSGHQAKHEVLTREFTMSKAALADLDSQLAESEAGRLTLKLAETTRELEDANADIQTSKDTGAAASEKLNHLQSEEAIFQEKREKRLKMMEAEVKSAKSIASKAAAVHKEVQQEHNLLTLEVQRLKEESDGIGEAQAAAELSLTEAEESMVALEKVVGETRAQFEGAVADVTALKAELAGLDGKIKVLKKEAQATGMRKNSAELDMSKLSSRISLFKKNHKEAERTTAHMERKHPWIKTEKQFFGKEGTAFDFNAEELKEKGLGGRLQRLKSLQSEQGILSRKINKKVMGMIEKAESEYQDLVRKKSVIENDKSKIHFVIKELDAKKQQALSTTWVKVNRDFGSIFTALLPGAFAKLEPPEGQTVFEGLEVRVAFGSTWKQSLTELSGGQRSLLALSLILSLLLFKPAPMYILDEVDAALDLSHTQNIGSMLRTHFSKSQFIVVSLKEGMFNNADVIFRTKFVEGNSTVSRSVNQSGGKNAVVDDSQIKSGRCSRRAQGPQKRRKEGTKKKVPIESGNGHENSCVVAAS